MYIYFRYYQTNEEIFFLKKIQDEQDKPDKVYEGAEMTVRKRFTKS